MGQFELNYAVSLFIGHLITIFKSCKEQRVFGTVPRLISDQLYGCSGISMKKKGDIKNHAWYQQSGPK